MTGQTAELYYPNMLVRIILLGLEEVLGDSGLEAVLKHANLAHLVQNYPPDNLDREVPYTQIGRMMSSLQAVYGARGGQGLAMRSGRACFKYGLRQFGQLMDLSDPEYRLLPQNTKIRQGGRIFSGIFNEYTDQQVRLEEDEESFYWHMKNCPLCYHRHEDSPACHLAVGTLQEALYWVSGGKFYNIQETECVAKGDTSCTIRIDKLPIE